MLLLRREYNEYHETQKADTLPKNDVPNIFDAAAYGDVAELNEALKHGDVNALDADGMTALHHAAISLKFDNVDRILEEADNGLDPKIEDRFGRNPSYAVMEVHGSKDPQAEKMRDKLWPYVYPVADEDIELYADDAPEV